MVPKDHSLNYCTSDPYTLKPAEDEQHGGQSVHPDWQQGWTHLVNYRFEQLLSTERAATDGVM